MVKFIAIFIVTIHLSCAVANADDKRHVTVAAFIQNIEIILPTLAPNMAVHNVMKPKDCPPISSPLLKGTGHIGVEIAVICNALFAANVAEDLIFKDKGNNNRQINDVARGNSDILGGSIFPEGLKNIRGEVMPFTTAPIIPIGLFEKNICVASENINLLQATTLRDVQKYTAIVVESWQVDRKTIYAMKTHAVVEVSTPDTIATMIQRGRGDFVLVSQGQLHSTWAASLQCLPHVKVALKSPRLMLVSPKRPDIYNVLNTYIEAINWSDPKNDILRAFERSGFLGTAMKSKELIYP